MSQLTLYNAARRVTAAPSAFCILPSAFPLSRPSELRRLRLLQPKSRSRKVRFYNRLRGHELKFDDVRCAQFGLWRKEGASPVVGL